MLRFVGPSCEWEEWIVGSLQLAGKNDSVEVWGFKVWVRVFMSGEGF